MYLKTKYYFYQLPLLKLALYIAYRILEELARLLSSLLRH